jgi:glutamate--cysteine ligase
VRRFSLEERRAAQADVARSGLAARIAGRPALAWASELAEIASDGLRRIAERGESDADERPLLEPVFRQLARGKSPGDEVLDHWQREWRGSRERLIDYARY